MMRIATTILALVICPTPLFAATIYPDKSDPICDFRLEGPIELGDAEVLERMIRPSVNGVVLCLNSPGGSLYEGLSLFQAIWLKESVVTRVRSGDHCLSACALAFLGGSRTVGTGAIRSRQAVIEPGSQLGFHAPKLDVPEGVYSKEGVNSAYAAAVKSIGNLLFMSQVEEHGVNGMSTFLLQEMLRTAPESMYYINTIGRANMADVGLAYSILPQITWHGIKNICTTAIIKSRRDLQILGVERAYARFGNVGIDGAGRHSIAFEDRSHSWSDQTFMNFVFRGFSAPHRSERFCKVRISKYAWQNAPETLDNPKLPNGLGFEVVLWDDVDVPFGTSYGYYAERIQKVERRVNVPWFSILDPSMKIHSLKRPT